MSEFVLVILVTMGLGKEPATFEIRLPKETYKKCIEDSKTYKFPFKEIHKVTKLKDSHDQIIDHERITHILKSVQSKAKKNKIDHEIITRIWQIFIQEAIKLEYSKIKKSK